MLPLLQIFFVVAQEALDYLERNLATFNKLFADFHIQKSDYRLLAGFDEDLIRGHLGFLNQIHIFLRFEPPDIESFLLHLSPALGKFSAFIFTDKLTYRIPSSLSDFYKITRRSTQITVHKLPSGVSTLSQDLQNSSLAIGGPSGQGGNGGDGPSRKGKEREDSKQNPPSDSGKGTDGDAEPESPDPDSDGTRSADISFRVITYLYQYDEARKIGAPRGEPFQKLQVHGTVNTRRTSASQYPRRFAICETKFTDLRTTLQPQTGRLTYHQFQLDVRIDAKEKHTFITKIRPMSTSKYNPDSKVSHSSKKLWNLLASVTVSVVKPQATLGASGSRTREQSTSIEKTTRVSRIIQRDIGPIISWSFHIADPFDQETDLALSPEKLPHAHFEFCGKIPAPPPEHLTLEISTYWSLVSPQGDSAWFSSEDKPSFSNLCEIITLDLPSHLRGLHRYNADFHVWPKHSNLGSTVAKTEDELEEGPMTVKMVDTDHHISVST